MVEICRHSSSRQLPFIVRHTLLSYSFWLRHSLLYVYVHSPHATSGCPAHQAGCCASIFGIFLILCREWSAIVWQPTRRQFFALILLSAHSEGKALSRLSTLWLLLELIGLFSPLPHSADYAVLYLNAVLRSIDVACCQYFLRTDIDISVQPFESVMIHPVSLTVSFAG